MKCQEAEKSILLEGSGELGESKSRALSTHLDACASCRKFRQVMLGSMTALAGGYEPSEKVMQDVMRTARICAPSRKQVMLSELRPVLAMAASFVIIMGLLFSNYSPDRVGMELLVSDAQMMNPEDQVLSIMYDGLSEDDLAFNFLMTYEGEAEG